MTKLTIVLISIFGIFSPSRVYQIPTYQDFDNGWERAMKFLDIREWGVIPGTRRNNSILYRIENRIVDLGNNQIVVGRVDYLASGQRAESDRLEQQGQEYMPPAWIDYQLTRVTITFPGITSLSTVDRIFVLTTFEEIFPQLPTLDWLDESFYEFPFKEVSNERIGSTVYRVSVGMNIVVTQWSLDIFMKHDEDGNAGGGCNW